MKKTKTLVSLLVVCAVVFGVFSSTAFASGELMGDANLDGTVNVQDALAVLRATSGSATFNSAQKKAADVTYDGQINSVDALRILLYISGNINSLDKVGGEDGDDIDL